MTFIHSAAVIEEIRSRFHGRRILVVGDLMLDRYLWGRVDRISPEAPVPIVRLERETESAGGAANVARNLAALGLEVSLGGITGNDSARIRLLEDLATNGVDTEAVLADSHRVTTVKTRVVGDHQQMMRIDDERPIPLSTPESEGLLNKVRPLLRSARALVLSDYAKGLLTEEICRELILAANDAGIPILVDPKGLDFKRYANATLITPNRAELSLVSGLPAHETDALIAAAETLRDDLQLQWVVLTLGDHGIVLIGPGKIHRIPAAARDVFDVSGAGDTVIATFAAGLAADLGHIDTAHLSNLAAGIVVGKVGTATVSESELLTAIADESASEQASKIRDSESARDQARRWRAEGKKVVFTNGCFDLLHAGHVSYLESARRHGDRLIVGLNTDRSVGAIKGPDRPIIREGDRARVLAALASVDTVVLFNEDTPHDLILKLRPDVLAKGADYEEAQVVGAKDVRSWGGQVVLVPLTADQSSSRIIARMNESKDDTSGKDFGPT